MGDVFYIVGIGLTVLALVLSFAGLKLQKFPPSRVAMSAVLGFMGALVVATCAFAVVLAREEAEHREEEIAEEELAGEEELSGEEGALEKAAEPEGEASGVTDGEEETTAAVDGSAVFVDNGCGSCHTLAAAGTEAAVGPVLDDSLADKDEAYIEESILDPGAVISRGFGEGIMPTTYEESLSPEDLDALVMYLAESTSG